VLGLLLRVAVSWLVAIEELERMTRPARLMTKELLVIEDYVSPEISDVRKLPAVVLSIQLAC